MLYEVCCDGLVVGSCFEIHSSNNYLMSVSLYTDDVVGFLMALQSVTKFWNRQKKGENIPQLTEGDKNRNCGLWSSKLQNIYTSHLNLY